MQHGTGCSSTGVVPTNVLRRSPVGLRLAVASDRPSALAVLVAGTSLVSHAGIALPYSLEPIGWTGCRLDVGPEFSAALVLSAGVHGGYGACDFARVPVASGGQRLFSQWLVLDSGGGFAATATQELRLQ